MKKYIFISIILLAGMVPLAVSAAPTAISNLTASPYSATSIVLRWTAPDSNDGLSKAKNYEVRWSLTTVTASNWSGANLVSAYNTITPKTAGTSEVMIVPGLSSGYVYYFAVKSYDSSNVASSISNVANVGLSSSDTIAPAQISDLSASSITSSGLTLNWTAVGDDGNTGTASFYDIRYSLSEITESNWASATEISGEPTPQSPGVSESMNITGLSEGTAYYFAIKAKDDSSNYSSLSNIVSITTLSDVPIAEDFAASNPTQNSIKLSWLTPTSENLGSFDIRYSLSEITESNWADANQVSGEPAPLLGQNQSFVVAGLNSDTIYYFAVKVANSSGAFSAMSNVVPLRTSISPTSSYSAGDLLRGVDGKVYLVAEGNIKRWVENIEAFNENGYSWESVIDVSDSVIDFFETGTSIQKTAVEIAEGSLIRARGDYKVYIVKGNYRRHILNPQVFAVYSHFSWGDIKDVDLSDVEKYEISSLVRADGDPKVYQLSNDGTKQWLNITAQEFTNSYSWDSVYIINQAELNLYK